MYTVDDPWGEKSLTSEEGPSLWVHATMCWFAGALFALYFALDWLINGFDTGSVFWGTFASYYLWRAVVYSKDASAVVE